MAQGFEHQVVDGQCAVHTLAERHGRIPGDKFLMRAGHEKVKMPDVKTQTNAVVAHKALNQQAFVVAQTIVNQHVIPNKIGVFFIQQAVRHVALTSFFDYTKTGAF